MPESPWAGTDVSVVPTSLWPERENDKLLTTIAELTVKVKKKSAIFANSGRHWQLLIMERGNLGVKPF